MEGVLEKTFCLRLVEKPAHIGFVLAKKQRRIAVGGETKIAQFMMFNFKAAVVSCEFGFVAVRNP